MAVSAELVTRAVTLKSMGLPRCQIAAETGLSVYQVYRALKSDPSAAATPSWWTQERDDAAKAHYLAGDALSVVADKIGARSKSAVLGRLRRLGVLRPDEINIANRAASGRRAAIRTNGAKCTDLAWWTPARDAEAARLVMSGLTFKTVAEMLGATSKNAVIGRMHRLGVKRPAPTAPMGAMRVAKIAPPRPVMVISDSNRPAKPNKPAKDPVVKLVSNRPDPVAAAAFAPSNPRPFEERRRSQCAWPIDQADGSMLACCEPITGQRWCVNHTVIGSRPVKSHKKTPFQRRAGGFDFRRLA